jgi:methanogenic corrinoid protein MtbC1
VRARGVDPRRICLDLLAPAARRLGELWVADECDFTQVTLGLWRLQQVQHDVATCFRLDVHAHEHGRRALFCTLPGDQHTFGVSMLADFFRHRHWDVRLDCPAHPSDTLAALQRESFDLLGVSLGSETRLDELGSWIARARRISRRRDLVVMVGGPLFAERADLAAGVGADAGACDAATALDVAEALLPVRFAHG